MKDWLSSRWLTLVLCAVLLLAFLVVSWQYDPLQRKLRADPSIMLYVGQQILRGNPPYKTVTIVKTPVTGILAAAAIASGRALGWNDVFAARAGFMLLGGLLVVVTFLCTATLWKRTTEDERRTTDDGRTTTDEGRTTNDERRTLSSITSSTLNVQPSTFSPPEPGRSTLPAPRSTENSPSTLHAPRSTENLLSTGIPAALFAALALLGMDGVSQRVTDGPSPKVPFILFGMAALWLAARRNWFLAGAAGALSFLTWQPGLAYVAVVWLAVFLTARAEWKRALIRSVAGALTPIALVALYLAPQGALDSALKQTLGANASYFGAAKVGAGFLNVLRENAVNLMGGASSCFRNEQLILILGIAGLASILGISLWRARRGDRTMLFFYAPLLLSLGALGAFTLVDFQSCADLLPFFPYLSLGLGWLLATLLALLVLRARPNSAAAKWLAPVGTLLIALLILYYGVSDVGRSGNSDALGQQRNMAAGVSARLGPDDNIQQFGDAVLLVLLNRENATRYMHLGDKQGAGILRAEGVDPAQLPNLIAASHPRIITLSRAKDQPWAEPLYQWIQSNYTLVEGYDAQSGGTPQVTEIYLSNSP